MLSRLYITILSVALFFCSGKVMAQSVEGNGIISPGNDITLVYDINIISEKETPGIEDTYNGGIKTVMIKDGKTRVRLVSLMRIQNIYLYKRDSALAKVLITKESGAKKYKYTLTPSEWKFYNERYDSLSYTFLNDSLEIAGHTCKKSIIKLKDGKEVIAYYSTQLKPLDKYTEPMFAGLPGMVLRYEHEAPKGSISFTLNKISFDELDKNLFIEPVKGYKEQKYHPASH